jgi:acetoin:2,6-dichlorophenolindophenol oxidoreductase subunit beta
MADTTYCSAIRDGLSYCMHKDPKCFAIGQGLWSPWYVGGTMDGLEKIFGRERVIDTPVSEQATTGIAIGAALQGYRPVVIHPRMDFMILALDQIVNQAAKWHHMLGGGASPSVVVRSIVNRGGEQGAQHSQALHAWLAHIPGLRVVMPATVQDARDLLIGAIQSRNPTIYIDDRWLYDDSAALPDAADVDLAGLGPQRLRNGGDLSIVAASYSTKLALKAAEELTKTGIECDVIDLRVVNPFDASLAVASVRKTGRLLAVDGGWLTCGLASEIVASVSEKLAPADWRAAPARIALPAAPAPTSKPLEQAYYPTAEQIAAMAKALVRGV